MIFKCGITFEEMVKRWEQWHDFFAILPVTVHVDNNGNRTCAWLQTIQRKRKTVGVGMGAHWVDEYRMKP
jgi:hypothetical protein